MAKRQTGFGLSFGTVFILLFLLWLVAPAFGIPTSPLAIAGAFTQDDSRFGSNGEDEARGSTTAVSYIADDLEIGGNLLSSIRQIGEPTCMAPEGAGQRAVYSGSVIDGRTTFRPTSDRDTVACLPRPGDLVVAMGPNNRIVSIVPDFANSPQISQQGQWLQMRGRYQHR